MADRPAAVMDKGNGLARQMQMLAMILFPLLLLYLAQRSLKRPLPGLKEKCFGPRQATTPGRIMLHGVSLGEAALMRPVLEALDQPCLLSTSTSTGWQGLQKYATDHHCSFFPFDLPWAVDRYLSKHRPRAVLLFELEIWPNFLQACRRRGIPVIIVNARMSARSYQGYRRLRAYGRRLFTGMQAALAQNSDWGARLKALGIADVRVTGSLKADMVSCVTEEHREAEAERIGLVSGPAHDKQVLLLASTSVGEESGLIAQWQSWPHHKQWQLVICPRHPERGTELQNLCQQHGISAGRSSVGDRFSDSNQVIIVDEIGRLGALYANACLAIVGGSLGSGRGGQNMLEAAAAGCCTIVGPDTRNQIDGMTLLRDAEAVTETTADQLLDTIKELAADAKRRQQLGQAAQLAWQQGRGAIARVMQELARLGVQ